MKECWGCALKEREIRALMKSFQQAPPSFMTSRTDGPSRLPPWCHEGAHAARAAAPLIAAGDVRLHAATSSRLAEREGCLGF